MLVLRRETNLEQASLDGRITATRQIDGLQIGDILDFAYTRIHADPVLQGHSFDAEQAGLPGRRRPLPDADLLAQGRGGAPGRPRRASASRSSATKDGRITAGARQDRRPGAQGADRRAAALPPRRPAGGHQLPELERDLQADGPALRQGLDDLRRPRRSRPRRDAIAATNQGPQGARLRGPAAGRGQDPLLLHRHGRGRLCAGRGRRHLGAPLRRLQGQDRAAAGAAQEPRRRRRAGAGQPGRPATGSTSCRRRWRPSTT